MGLPTSAPLLLRDAQALLLAPDRCRRPTAGQLFRHRRHKARPCSETSLKPKCGGPGETPSSEPTAQGVDGRTGRVALYLANRTLVLLGELDVEQLAALVVDL